MLTASTDIRFLKGVGEKRAELLKKKGIDTVGALLRYFPRDYLDWRNVTPVSEAPFFENVCIRARIVTPIEKSYIRSKMELYKFVAEDSSARFSVTLFNQKFLAEKLHTGSEYLFYGKLGGNFAMRQMSSPVIMESGFNGIEPIYSATDRLSSKTIEKLVKTALQLCELPPDIIPETVSKQNKLCDFGTAICNIHFPMSPEILERAKKRLVFEELFVLQIGLSFLKRRKRALSGCVLKKDFTDEFKRNIGFSLTGAQERAISECLADMFSGRLMNRLVQGDVGSGKTAVAAALCYITAKNGYQSALMAPTEILAEQHFKTLSGIIEGSGIKCVLLTGSLTKKQKSAVKEALANGEADIAVGTHALLSDDVTFDNLGLVITDEQHRFGVAQRAGLSAKGNNPHTLVMSATPIPRTMGLIIYGDLDISIIDEYPKGRQAVSTYLVTASYHERIYNYIKKFLDSGRQGYIVCPLVEESEALDITSAEEYYEQLSENEFRGYKVALLHGKLRAAEKDRIMRRFADGEIQLLIATTVIEVGIDVPNAVIMVIENAERFGLSQLHQLRGRIGRGKYESVCILVSDSGAPETKKRLEVIKNCRDGFKIADEDLALRGPGDFLGNRQHGLPEMHIADIFADRDVLHEAGIAAEKLIEEDPLLQKPENLLLKNEITELYKKLGQN